jgi:hypothetical protein
VTGQSSVTGTAVPTPEVVDSVDDLTAEWLAAALDLPVTAVTVRPIGIGQTGRSYRVGLTYADEVPGAPGSLVAKLAGGDLEARKRVSQGFRKEFGFYTELAGTVDIRIPACHYGAINADATAFVLLLEDLAPRQTGVQVEGCTPARAAAAVRNLAGLHAPRWNDEKLLSHAFLTPADETRAQYLGDIYQRAAGRFLDHYAARLDGEDAGTIRAFGEVVVEWQLARLDPVGIVHGDYRLDNLMFSPDGGVGPAEVVAVDWQTVTLAPPLRDVAYFLGTALETEVRRQQEETLVADYHRALVRGGVENYSFDACFADYRRGQLQGPFITVIGAGLATTEASAEADEMFLSMTRRSCAAVRDLRSLDAL